MNRSVVQWLQDLEKRIVDLEKRPLPQWPAPSVTSPLAELQKLADEQNKSSKAERKMCPKCGEKPNYFFHVKTCAGPKKKNNDADQAEADRRRDQGPT